LGDLRGATGGAQPEATVATGPAGRSTIGEWIAVRYIQASQRCVFCGAFIPKGKPGSRTGERGTKAWFRKTDGWSGEWECLACRTEGTRADLAREQERAAIAAHVRPMMIEGGPFDVLVDVRLRVIKGGRALWEAIREDRVASLRIVAVPEAVAWEMDGLAGTS